MIGAAARPLAVSYSVNDPLPGGALSGSAEPSRFSDRALDLRFDGAVAEPAKSRGVALRNRGNAHSAPGPLGQPDSA
jgi:hypothetical protein